jgi:hypothetical protein
MLFSTPPAPLPKITAPTAAEICEKSKPSPEGKALLTPDMKPPEFQKALEQKKLGVDSVHFLAHGMQPKDSICWGAQSCKLVVGKLSPPELEMFKGLELWLKTPNAALLGNISACIPKIDFTGPAGWCGQAALWVGMPALAAAAIAGAILLCAGLKVGVAMPPIPKPKIPIPPLGLLTPEIMLKFPLPPVPPLPVLAQPKLMKILLPFIDIGKLVACGKVSCC